VTRFSAAALGGALGIAAWCYGSLVHGATCSRCGCTGDWGRTCRAVSEEAEVEAPCWGVQCEEFCVPGPSCRGCRETECICAAEDRAADDPPPAQGNKTAPADPPVHCAPRTFSWFRWFPQCAEVMTRKKLMKRTEKVKVTRHKWVVETLCPACCAAAPGETPPKASSSATP